MSDLFSSLNIKGKRLKNRIVVAPTERVGLTYTGSIMGADVIHEYEMLAENNAGLIMTQSLVVAPEDAAAVGFPLPGIWKETQIAPLKRIVEAAHQNGGFAHCAAWCGAALFTAMDHGRGRAPAGGPHCRGTALCRRRSRRRGDPRRT